MPSMRGGVLSPDDARRLMSVLQEMTEYVDGEDLDAISAQKPIYEVGSDEGAPNPQQTDVHLGPPDMGEEEEEPKVDVDALILEGPHGDRGPNMEKAPRGMLHQGMGRRGR